jgi:hypothetical protein
MVTRSCIASHPPNAATSAVAIDEMTARVGENAEETADAVTLASRLAALLDMKPPRSESVRLNAWATLMPASSSASVAETSPIASWRRRNARRATYPKSRVAPSITGTTASVTSASRQSTMSMPTSVAIMPRAAPSTRRKPCERKELSVSMSLMRRLMRSPDSTLSK